jgi:cytochrome c oxidase cbb3-type subunit III
MCANSLDLKPTCMPRQWLGTRWAWSLLMALPIAYSVLAAAHGGAKQTSKANADAIKEGASLFRANCSPCHGLNAHGGGRGPDLTSGRWTHGSTDDDLFRTITQGVPGTDMPANSFEDSETHTIIVYLRSLALPKNITVVGNAEKGKKIFFGAVGCSNCHMVRGIGGVLGPDLSRVGAARSVSYLVESIRDPDKELSVGMADPNNHYVVPLVYDTVTVITANGEKITGVARNEDTYSIQMITTEQELQLFLKKDLKEVFHQHKSLMPPYSEDALDAGQLQDLIAYLETLRAIDDKENR